jgi:predicted HTH transcriptional regulator
MPGVQLSESPMVNVILTMDAGEEDLKIRKEQGVIGLRRHQLQRICEEAFQQNGLLTVEDLANRIFNCGERTITRDLAALRKQDI